MIETATQLNTPGPALAEMPGVHAMTDVTGLRAARPPDGSVPRLAAQGRDRFADVPVLSAARHLAEQGYVTGASDRNWASCEPAVTLPPGAPAWHRKMLTDPQTSGGLLVACAPESARAVLDVFTRQGFKHARVIGRLAAGDAGIVVV